MRGSGIVIATMGHFLPTVAVQERFIRRTIKNLVSSTFPLYFRMPHLQIPQSDTSAKFGHAIIQLKKKNVTSFFGSRMKEMRNGD